MVRVFGKIVLHLINARFKVQTMGIFLTIAGVIIVLYTFSSVVGLWLAHQVMDATSDGQVMPEALGETPDHHLELMANYARGWRHYVWSASIVALFTTLLAMATSSPLAFWALGCAIVLDTLLFMTYPDIKRFLAQTDMQERLIDVTQSMALLAAFTLLLWINLRSGQIID